MGSSQATTASARPYPAYRDSGVPWLGEIPAHWQALQLKHVAYFMYGQSLPLDEREDGEVAVYGSNGQVGTHTKSNTLAPAILIGRKGSYGKVVWASSEAWAIDTTFFIDRRNTEAHLTWLFYLLSTLGLDTYSEDSAVPGLSRDTAHAKRVPLPPLAEQRAIAAYLDRETARIDALVERHRRLIALLQEKRTALITRAVTRGLDPDAPLRDSGVPWLGEIPEHWQVRHLKYVAYFMYGQSLPQADREDGEIPVYGSNGQVGTHIAANTLAPALLVGRKGSYGKVVWTSSESWAIDTTFFIDRRSTESDLKWIFYLLGSLSLDTYSEDSAVPGLSRETAHSNRVPLPPLAEQRAIAAYLDRETARIDAVVARCETLIERLQEYRAALITAAVTGQIDVRERERVA